LFFAWQIPRPGCSKQQDAAHANAAGELLSVVLALKPSNPWIGHKDLGCSEVLHK